MFKNTFLFYLPKLKKYIIIKARHESDAVSKLINCYRPRFDDIDGYYLIKNVAILK